MEQEEIEAIEERAVHRVKLSYLTEEVKELGRILREHMRSEDTERKAIDRKLMLIAIVVFVDAVFPGGAASLAKLVL